MTSVLSCRWKADVLDCSILCEKRDRVNTSRVIDALRLWMWWATEHSYILCSLRMNELTPCKTMSPLLHTMRAINIFRCVNTLIARFMGPTWGPSGADKTQVGPMLGPMNFVFWVVTTMVAFKIISSSFQAPLPAAFRRFPRLSPEK